jgi:hypothetical protein
MRTWMRALPMLVGAVLVWGWAGAAEAQLFGPKATVTNPEGKSIDEAQQEAYDGPKARVAVSQLIAAAPAPDATGSPSALGVLKSIRADLDRDVVVDLNEVKSRGAILSVVVTLRYTGSKKESQSLSLDRNKSTIMNYDSGESAELVNADGFTSGRLNPGDAKLLRLMYKVPTGAKTVGITLSGIGTFDDVQLAK